VFVFDDDDNLSNEEIPPDYTIGAPGGSFSAAP
jgi:hypothetical protein